jgi:hypothetical protein
MIIVPVIQAAQISPKNIEAVKDDNLAAENIEIAQPAVLVVQDIQAQALDDAQVV